MAIALGILTVALFLIPGGGEPENPWIEKVSAALSHVREARTINAYAIALDTTWRADDWQTAAALADEARAAHPNSNRLRGAIARAYWRAGRIADAERVAAELPHDADDTAALTTLLQIGIARGESEAIREIAERLASRENLSAAELSYLIAASFEENRMEGLGALIRKALARADKKNGYPEIYLEETLSGVADFVDAVGAQPLNRLTRAGEAPMPASSLNLPYCDIFINGKGPYRFIIDTGGSMLLSVDEEVAAEAGLRSIAKAAIHGVSGTEESHQTLVDELKIGGIVCSRVMARVFGVRKALFNMADGIVGTGIFAEGRMTLDFERARLIVALSSEQDGPGQAADLRLVGDAKLVALIDLHGEPAAAILDSGADAVALSPSRLKRIFPDRDIRTFSGFALGVGSGKMPSIALAPGANLVLAGRAYEKVSGLGLDVLDTMLSPMLGVQCDVLIGMPIFREMKQLTVDFPRTRMWIEWLEREENSE